LVDESVLSNISNSSNTKNIYLVWERWIL
jgi:hypothetical protein